MLKLKNILPVLVVLLFLGVASTAFGQVTCTTASTPVTHDTATGFTEPAGDITFTCTQATGGSGMSAPGTIIVVYPAQITNCQSGGTQSGCPTATGYPVAKPIAITTVSGSGVCAQPSIGAASVTNQVQGQIVISVPQLAPGSGLNCSFTLTGVLLDIADTSSAGPLSANISASPASNLFITTGGTNPVIVTSILPAILGNALTSTAAVTVLNTGVVVGGSTFTLTVAENPAYVDAFRSLAQFNSGAATQGLQVQLTFAGTALVTGTTITCATPGATPAANAVPLISPATGIATKASPTITLEWNDAAAVGLTTADAFTLGCAFSTTLTSIPAGTITATAKLSPTGAAFGAGTAASPTILVTATTGQIPRYSGPTVNTVTVVNVVAATSHMLYPFLTASGSTGPGSPIFDTGLTVANTGLDPYGSSGQSGPVTFVVYPQSSATGTVTPFCVATGAGAYGTTGAPAVSGITAGCTVLSGTLATSGGLSTGGVVVPGSSWVINFSQLLGAAGVSLPAGGIPYDAYGFAIGNFPLGHGSFFVYNLIGINSAGFSGGPALTVAGAGGTNPSTTGRSLVLDSLGH